MAKSKDDKELPRWVGQFNLETDDGCLAVLELSLKSFLSGELSERQHAAVVEAVRVAGGIGMAKHRKAPKTQAVERPMGITANGPFRPFGGVSGDA